MKYFISILLLSICLSAHAQDVLYSGYEKFDFKSDDYAVIGKTGGLLYTYLNTADGAFLESYNDSMNPVAKVLLDFIPSKIYEMHVVSYPDHIILLYQVLERNKVVQYAAWLDEKGRLRNRPIMLGSFKTGIFGAVRTYFSTAVSDNKKSIVIYSANDKGSSMDFDYKEFDDNLANLKHGHAKFTTDNPVQHGEVNVANDGTIYVAVFTPTGAQNYADAYWLLALAPGSTRFEPKELPLDTKFATGGYVRIDNVNNCIYFGGFYSDKKSGNFKGVIYASYSMATSSYQNTRFIPFDDHLINEAGRKKKNSTFDNYMVRQLIALGDGGFVLIAEEQYVTTRTGYIPDYGPYPYYSPNMTTMVHEFHFNDIMAISYNKDGARQWNTFIPKNQYSQEDGGLFSSYALLNTGGTLAFLFNDFNATHSRIQLATVSANGKSDINYLSSENSDNPDWIPRNGRQVSARELVIPCFHKKEICFAKVVF